MKSVLRLALSTVALAFSIALAPHATFAACSSGGTVSNVNDCVPEGVKATDCALEWSISPVPPLNPKTGVPTNKIFCLDNDPACDADNTPGQCTFMVGACVNVVDSRFTCTPSDTTTYLLKKPSTKDAIRPDKNPFARDNFRNVDLGLDAVVPTASTNVCSEERAFVVPLKKGIKKATLQIQAVATAASLVADKDTIKFTCAPNPNIGTMPIASAKQIANASELIGGPVAMGGVGDWLIENDKVRFVIRDIGRDFSFVLTYGGHLLDADLQRDSGPGRDNFLAMTPLINISSTDNPTSISILNDGSAGGPAVIQTSGPDDLFDPIDPAVAIKGFNSALSIPPFAIDNNIPVTVMNEYTLNPGDDFMKIETIVQNDGPKRLEIYMGDYTSGGGQLEIVAPGLGFGDGTLRLGGNPGNEITRYPFNYLGWFGFGNAQGVSYGLIPQLAYDTSAFTQSGVVVPVYGQSLLSVLSAGDQGLCSKTSGGVVCGGASQPACDVVCEINTDCEVPDQPMDIGPCKNGKPAGLLSIPVGGNNSFTRWFAVSDNGMGRILDARHKLIARGEIPEEFKTAYIQGTVRVGGVPVDGARVAVVQTPGSRLSQYAVADVFETKDGGFYQGTVPVGDYRVMVKIPGYPYEGGGASPQHHIVSIKKASVVDFDVPATGFVRVDVTNGLTSDPIAAKVSVVGATQAVDPGIDETIFGSLHAFGNIFGYDAREKTAIHGLPAVRFADVSGSTPVFALQPGAYQIVVSHGPEFSVSKQNLTVVVGTESTPQVVTASVVPVIDTTGFISADHHVHLTGSPDSRVSKEERIVTMLAEGVDYFAASNHDTKTDLTADVAALGASSLIKTSISDEITTFNQGHFGAYPMTSVDPSSVTGGAIDWGRSGVAPGLGYPSDGSYDLSIDEMALVAKGAPHNSIVVQANHFNDDDLLGYFRMAGIDTTVAPPQSSTPPGNVRQNPALTNLYTDELTALELWIESTRAQNALALGENLGDYISMLNKFDSTNPLQRKGIVCDSDTHQTTIIQAGGPRNMLASTTDDPALLDPADLADAVNAGRNVCTSGPFVRVSVEGNPGLFASHDLADPLLVLANGGNATVHIDVQSPTWAEYDRIEVYFNNVPSCVTTPPNSVGGVKKVCTATPNFVIAPTKSTVPVNGDFRLESTSNQPLTITQDSWVIVVVRGQDGVSRPLFPMNPQSMFDKACNTDPCKRCGFTGATACPFFGTCTILNQTVTELSDGNLGQCGVTAMAIANPLFIDFDNDGLYKGVALP